MSGFGYNVLGFGANAAGGGADLPSDDEFNRVSFLSHFDGSNDGVNSVFDDSSDSNHTITANGDVTQGSFGPFARPDGEWGVSFDGAGDYLSADNSSDWALADGEWTIEAWVFIKPSGSVKQAIIGHWTNGSRGWQARVEPSGSGYKLRWTWTTNGSVDTSYIGSIVADFNTWNHVAWVRASNTITLYVNGVAGGTVSGENIYTPNTPLVIGDWDTNAADLNGVISNLRLVKGTAVYTSNFTPSTSKLTAITNTKLLTCQSNRFVDNSASGHTLTPTGNAAVSAFGPFLTSEIYSAATNGASAYFDGAGDYLDADDGVTFGTGEFTIEFFVYLNKEAQQFLFDARPDSVNTVYPVISVNSNDTLNYYANSGNRITSSTSEILSKNAWHHIALCRSGTSTKMFLDGTQVGSTYSDSTNYADSGRMRVGATKNATNRVEGYMSDVRVVNSALYTSNFTPPTAPLTAITNTKLLLNMKNGQAIDSAAQDNIKLEGGAKISTAQYKFGTSSILFDNTTSCRASFKIKPFGTGDWTIEGFFRAIQFHNDNHAMWDTRPPSTSNTGPLLVDESTPGLTREMYFYNGTKHSLGSASALSANTWYHIAVCRSGTSTKVFLDGTQVGSTISDSADYVNETFTLGSYSYSNIDQGWDGYVDDFRISYMARYTSNFTAPTEPFADKGQ